jgi:hypothetical protein
MKLFAFDPMDYREVYARRGWVHIPGGLTPEFFSLLDRQVGETLGQSSLPEFQLGGKQQALYEFPAGGNYLEELRSGVGTVTGLDASQLVLAERHIKAYEADAECEPSPHKDRFASQVSVGFSVRIPEASRLVLYPTSDVSVNPYHSWAELRAAFPAERSPERILSGAEAISISDRPGDVVMFRGNALWHKRSNPANAIVLYLKLNGTNCDTLGEDPGSAQRRAETLILAERGDLELLSLVPELGRAMLRVERRSSRDWQESIHVCVAGAPPIEIDETELAILRAADGRTPVALFPKQPPLRSVLCEHVRRLARIGAIDLRAAREQARARLAA